MDFSDLISYTIELFRKRPKILKKYQDQFKYILVDEFQDTNSAQYELVKLLLTEPCNITVVGDDDQSIYRFRGASLSNIMNFSNDFQEAKKIILNQNYRSSNKVLKHAYELIQKNNPNRLEFKQKINKELKPNLGIDGRVDHIHSQTLEDEINNVITKIIELKKEYSCNWNDIAVLVRANAHAQPFIELLNQLHLPYKFLALSGLYAKPIILDALAWMRVVNLPYDSPSLYRILSHETLGIDHEDIAKLSMHCKKKCLSLFDALDGNCKLSQSSTLKINEILNTLTTLRINSKRKPASELFVDIIKQTGISACVAMLDEQNQIEQNNLLQKFFERIKKFEYVNEDKTLKNFLSEFELERSGGELGALSGDPTEGPDVVQIMTVHASKGLEFKFVLLVNLVEQRFPSVRKSDPIEVPNGLIMISNVNDVESDEHIEEERRLFYVAMTRAKEHLYIFSSDDYGGLRKRKISRFVSELGLPVITELNKKSIINNSEVYLDKNDYNYKLPKNISFTQIAAFSNCPAQYKFAHILRVPVFGKYQMSFGKSIHDTLEKFAKEYVNLTNTVQQSLFSKQTCDGIVTIPTKEKLFDFYKLAWIDEWYPSAYVKEEYYNKGKDILNDYYDKLITEKPNILLIEKDFTIKIGDLTMKGRIDRIDKIEVGHEIIDYKTGNPKEKLTWDDKKQLILYSLACERCFDPSILITKVTYHYLENNTSVSFKPSDDDKQKLIDDVIKCVDKITHSDFKPTPGFHCQYCDFKDICENSDY
jgi:DNA helicase-2/ATP-dependent DNA helicase PcrA